MVNVARESISDVDLAILVVEPIASIGPQEEGLIDKIKSSHCPAILAINKIDTVEKDALLEQYGIFNDTAEQAEASCRKPSCPWKPRPTRRPGAGAAGAGPGGLPTGKATIEDIILFLAKGEKR